MRASGPCEPTLLHQNRGLRRKTSSRPRESKPKASQNDPKQPHLWVKLPAAACTAVAFINLAMACCCNETNYSQVVQ